MIRTTFSITGLGGHLATSSRCSSSRLICCIVAMVATARVVNGQKYYAVYFDPATESTNPKGEGFTPVGPDEWYKVNYFKDFFDWNNAGISLGSSSRSCVNRSPGNQQNPISQRYLNTASPLKLADDSPWWKCNDRHPTHEFQGMGCKYDFQITPYGLRADLMGCTDKMPKMDMSRTSTPWKMVYMEIKVPAQHVVDDGRGGYKQYDAELILAHTGTGIHAGKMAFLSILIDGKGYGEEYRNVEIQKYIREWKVKMHAKYQKCSVRYNTDNCTLRKRTKKNTGNNNNNKKNGNNRLLRATNVTENDVYEDFALDEFDEIEDYDDAIEEAESESIYVADPLQLKNSTNTIKDTPQDTIHSEHLRATEKRKLTMRPNQEPFRPYRLLKELDEGFYWGYDGSLIEPPCNGEASWRVKRESLKIAQRQLDMLNKLIAGYTNDNCELGTYGKRQLNGNEKCFVDVTRPVQYITKEHHLTNCNFWTKEDWFA